MKELTSEQEKLIEKYFKEVISDEEFKRELKEDRRSRAELFKRLLSRDNLEKITEIELGELISNLWASEVWKNKDFLVKKVIERGGGAEALKEKLYKLLYGQEPFEERFSELISKKIGLGIASITEILCLLDSAKFGIWNNKVRKALKNLKFDNFAWINKYSITADEYKEINTILQLIAEKLRELGLKDADLLTVDYFLWRVANKLEARELEVITKEISDWDHDEIVEYIEDIGELLGFETETEKLIAKGAKVDVVWTAKIANLGSLIYVFEVQKGGSADSLILNLLKALSSNPAVQKIIAVADKKQIDKIKKEIETLPESFRKLLTFWEVSDVIVAWEKLSEAMEIISNLGLVKSQYKDTNLD